MTGPWFVWTGTVRAQGVFPTFEAAFAHVRTLTNDHRRRFELNELVARGYRYTGPRGRRHGTRLVAFLFTADAGALLGIDVRACYGDSVQATRC